MKKPKTFELLVSCYMGEKKKFLVEDAGAGLCVHHNSFTGHEYWVTHVESGMRILAFKTRSLAFKAAKMLIASGVDWTLPAKKLAESKKALAAARKAKKKFYEE